MRHLLVVGGLDQFGQATELQKRPHIVVATPGRLADMMNTAIELQQAFKRTAVLVLDEADRVLEHCFEQPLRDIMKVPQPPMPSACHAQIASEAWWLDFTVMHSIRMPKNAASHMGAEQLY